VPAAVRTGRFGLLLALLLVLLGVSAAVAPGSGGGASAPLHGPLHGPPVLGESTSAAPSMNDDLHDWLRVSVGVRSASTTTLVETWWVVCPCATVERALRGRSSLGLVGAAGAAAAEPTPRSSRAPPVA